MKTNQKTKKGRVIAKRLAAAVLAVIMITMAAVSVRADSADCVIALGADLKADERATVLTALIWIIGNGVIGSLHMAGVLDDGIMLLLCSAYSVCDMICILFFCPFQTWLLKNKCCGTCRIYNWDYAMMFTPLFFVGGAYARSLLVMSVVLLMRWEITFYLHPERFSEQSNEFLRCKNCREKLCAHKTQLKTHWRAFEEYSRRKREALRK